MLQRIPIPDLPLPLALSLSAKSQTCQITRPRKEMCKPQSATLRISNYSSDLTSVAGFIRINPATAPLTPPGAAPTLTTIYDEANGNVPSEFASPNNFLSKESPTARVKKKSKRRFRLGSSAKAAPANVGVEGTKKEKKRVQHIADSLDLGADPDAEVEPAGSAGQGIEVERRRETVVGFEEPNRIMKNGDGRLDFRDQGMASIGLRLPGGKRRSSIG